jgi:single-strand DNA-binding protein
MYQKLTIIGNLGGDPELRYTPKGAPYTRFSVAVNRSWTNAEGERQEEVTWYRVAAWGKLAEACNQYLAKGRTVLVEAEQLHASAYLTKANEPAATLEVTARVVRFLGGNGTGKQQPQDEEEAAQ